MKETLKGVFLDEDTIKEIQEIAKKEKRSFTRQVQVMLQKILKGEKKCKENV